MGKLAEPEWAPLGDARRENRTVLEDFRAVRAMKALVIRALGCAAFGKRCRTSMDVEAWSQNADAYRTVIVTERGPACKIIQKRGLSLEVWMQSRDTAHGPRQPCVALGQTAGQRTLRRLGHATPVPLNLSLQPKDDQRQVFWPVLPIFSSQHDTPIFKAIRIMSPKPQIFRRLSQAPESGAGTAKR